MALMLTAAVRIQGCVDKIGDLFGLAEAIHFVDLAHRVAKFSYVCAKYFVITADFLACLI